jgi:hypothetical protein
MYSKASTRNILFRKGKSKEGSKQKAKQRKRAKQGETRKRDCKMACP